MGLASVIYAWRNLILADLFTALQLEGFRFDPANHIGNLVELLLMLTTLAFMCRRLSSCRPRADE